MRRQHRAKARLVQQWLVTGANTGLPKRVEARLQHECARRLLSDFEPPQRLPEGLAIVLVGRRAVVDGPAPWVLRFETLLEERAQDGRLAALIYRSAPWERGRVLLRVP